MPSIAAIIMLYLACGGWPCCAVIDQADPDQLAKLIIGEGYHLIDGQEGEAAAAIIHTAFNNMLYVGQNLDDELSRWYGYHPDIKVTAEARGLAKSAVILYHAGYDLSNGSRFLLSAQDIEALGVDKEAGISLVSGNWGLYGYAEWPKED